MVLYIFDNIGVREVGFIFFFVCYRIFVKKKVDNISGNMCMCKCFSNDIEGLYIIRGNIIFNY